MILLRARLRNENAAKIDGCLDTSKVSQIIWFGLVDFVDQFQWIAHTSLRCCHGRGQESRKKAETANPQEHHFSTFGHRRSARAINLWAREILICRFMPQFLPDFLHKNIYQIFYLEYYPNLLALCQIYSGRFSLANLKIKVCLSRLPDLTVTFSGTSRWIAIKNEVSFTLLLEMSPKRHFIGSALFGRFR